MTVVAGQPPTAGDDDSSYDEADKIPLSKLVDMTDDTKKINDDSSTGQQEESKMGGDLKPNDNTVENGTDANQNETKASGPGIEIDVPGKDIVEESSHDTSDPPNPRSTAVAAAATESTKEAPPTPNNNDNSKESSEGPPEVQFLEQRNVNAASETHGVSSNALVENKTEELSTQSNIDQLVTTKEPPKNIQPEPMDVDQVINDGTDMDNKDATTMEEETTIPESQPAVEMAMEQSLEPVDTLDSNRLQDSHSATNPENASNVDHQPTVTENGVRRERPKSDHSPQITPMNPVELPESLHSMEMEVDAHEATETPPEATVTEVLDFVLPPTVPAKIFSSCENDDETGDVFAAFKGSHPKKTSKKRPLQVKISIAVSWDTKEDEKKEDDTGNYSPNPPSTFRCDILNVSVKEQIAQAEAELEDSLSFFRDSHEDQDPAFAAFMKSQKRKQIEAELKALELEDEAGRKEIDAVVGSQIKSKQASTDDQFERYKAKKAAEEKQAMTKLQTMFNDKVVSNQSKINQGIEVLKKRHSTEAQRYLAQHRQQVAQRNLPEHIASQEWANLQQQLNNKHKSQVQEFMGKGEDVKKRTEAEYRREMAKIRSQYEKQVQDVENNRRVIYQKIFAGYQQIRQRYVKRHLQKIMQKREVLEKALGEKDAANTLDVETKLHSKDDSRSSQEEHLALQAPSPIKSSGQGLDTFPYEKSGAAARHKHRKGVLSQISKQLSVEIHNEGVWMAVLQEKKEEKKKEQPSDPHTESEQKLFLPWGIKARDFLESIICGEIPSELELSEFDFGDSVAMNGGHLRCVLTDLRTSDETARMQRVQAVGEQPNIETAALEQKAIELQAAYNNADKVHAKFEKDEKDIIPQVKEAMQDYEAKKLHWDNFRSKFGKFLGPDGNPLPQTNPSDRQKLTQAIAKYRGNVENAEKQAKAAQLKLRKVKEEVQKYSNLKKQTQRAAAIAAAAVKKQKSIVSSGQSFSRVKDSISALELTADKRREQLNLKRTNSTSSTWVQNLPGVPGPLRRSLWHKMHRRRQQIVLRPSQDTVTADLKAVLDRLSKVEGANSVPEASKPLELQKAEQAYLLSAHPLAPRGDIIASVPSSSSPWGEPGWHLVLDVPKPISGQILPRAIGAPIVEKNLSEINSAPGRQASSMLRSTQIRSLATPLSAISTVTSLAETNPGVAMSTQARHVENDPMNPTERQLEEGYAFNAKLIVPTKQAVPARRKSLSSTDSPGTSSNVKGGANMSIPASSAKQATSEHSVSGSPSKTPRKRKPTADAAVKPSQRRKPAPSKPTAAQAKALQVQQQKQRQALAAAAAAQRQQQKAQQQTQQLQQHQHLQPQTQHLQPQTQHLPPPTQHLQQPTQHLQPQNQHLPPQNQPKPQPQQQQQQTMGHSHYQRQPSINVMDRSQNSYGQFMQPLATPPNQAPPQNYQQQLYHQQQQSVQQRQVPQQQQFQPQQLAQLRMMQQQQQQQQAPSQQVQYGSAPHGMQPMPQFFQPMQQQFAHAPIGMPGQVVGQSGMPMNLQGNNNVRQNPPNGDDSNDPLFMLK